MIEVPSDVQVIIQYHLMLSDDAAEVLIVLTRKGLVTMVATQYRTRPERLIAWRFVFVGRVGW